MAAAQSNRNAALQEWKKNVHRWYPKLHQRAYFVPPVYMNRINYEQETVSECTVAVAKPPVKATPRGTGLINQDDVKDDQAQQHILHCLHEFFQQKAQVVFVLSQLNFMDYLGNSSFAAAAQHFPRPADLKSKNQERGDFDFLLIHRQYGLVAFEVKSIGTSFSDEVPCQAVDDKALVNRLQTVVKQMNKSREVLQYVTGDLPQPPRVTTSLMLPYITAAQLRGVLADNPQQQQALCDCLGIPHTEDSTRLALTSEQLSDKKSFWHVTDDVMQALALWWQSLMEEKGDDPNMNEQLYEDLIARFAGPASTVQVFRPSVLPRARQVVRTEGEGVSETAERFMDLVLSPQQISILNSKLSVVYLTGPPGTGKTVVLMLKAGQWLREGHDVHVVSMFVESTTAAYYLCEALNQKYSSVSGGKAHFCRVGDGSLERACDANRDVYVIIDEVNGDAFQKLWDKLKGQTKSLHMWVARILNNLIPDNIHVFTLHVPLRSPPCITRQVQDCITRREYVTMEAYEENTYPHTDGPSPRNLFHQGPGHDQDVKLDECPECGLQLAAVLRELHVGDSGAATSQEDSPSALKHQDVFVLGLVRFRDTCIDRTGKMVPASGLVRGLRLAQIPVRVFTRADTFDDSAVKDVATMTGPDEVLVSEMTLVTGLERKVVVWVQTEEEGSIPEVWAKVSGYSRSSAQLIIIGWPDTTSNTEKKAAKPEYAVQGAEGALASEEITVDRNLASEVLMQVLTDNITDEDVRKFDCVVQVTVTHIDGAHEETFFVNMIPGADRVVRGERPQSEFTPVCAITISAEHLPRFLREGIPAGVDLYRRNLIHIEQVNTLISMQLAGFFIERFPRIAAAFKSAMVSARPAEQ